MSSDASGPDRRSLRKMRAARTLRRWAGRLVPARCVLCQIAAGTLVCTACQHDFLPPAPRCYQCAARLLSAVTPLCGHCMAEPPAFDRTFALADYAPPLDGLIVALKYRQRLDLARVLGGLLAQRIAATTNLAHALHGSDSLVVPLPLSFERHAERGFNQAHEIARAFVQELGLPLAGGALLRIKHNAPQEALKLSARRRNVRGAFAVRADVDARTVFLIDDVMTSGSTLHEAAATLKRAGARSVTNLVLARTP